MTTQPLQLPNTAHDVARWVHQSLGRRANRETKQIIAEYLGEWLRVRNRLVVDLSQHEAAGGRPYLLDEQGAPWPLERGNPQTRLILHGLGLNGSEPAFLFVLEHLAMTALESGKKLRLARWHTIRNGIIYTSAGPHHVVRTGPDGIPVLVANGTDDVLFAADATIPQWEPADPVRPSEVAALCPPLEPPVEVPAYRPAVQEALLQCWFAGLVAGIRPLPILGLIGDCDGGKTTTARAIARALRGSDAGVATLGTRDPLGDLGATLTARPLAALDNLDADVPKEIGDLLAATATGANIESRQLYTDSTLLSRPAIAAVAVTSRTAAFAARADISERVLPLFTCQIKDAARVADDMLMAEVDANRDGLLSWGVIAASAMLAEATNAPSGLPCRFQGFARLFWARESLRGTPDNADPALRALRAAQAISVTDGDPLLAAIATYFDQIIGSTSGAWQGTPAELVHDLDAAGASLPYLGGGKAVARQLREGRRALGLVGLTLTESRQGNNTVFFLGRAP